MTRHTSHRKHRRIPVTVFLVAVALGGVAVAVFLGVYRAFDAPIALATPVPTATVPATTRDWQRAELVQVLSVDAGNQITVKTPDSAVETVRIAGLASPVGQECGAEEAQDATRDAISTQPVTLVPDVLGRTRDDQGRRLAYVVLPTQLSWTDGAISGGTGRVDQSRLWQYSRGYTAEQNEAEARNRGLWRTCWKGDK